MMCCTTMHFCYWQTIKNLVALFALCTKILAMSIKCIHCFRCVYNFNKGSNAACPPYGMLCYLTKTIAFKVELGENAFFINLINCK